MGRGTCVPSETPRGGVQGRWLGAALGALCLLPALVLLARLGAPAVRAWSAAQGDVAARGPGGVPAARVPAPLGPRRRRYTLTPARLRWDHFNLTYRILSFPRNLLSPRETRRGLAAAFRMWSDVSPFSFREVAPEQPSDLRIGGSRSQPRPRPRPRLLPGHAHGLPGVRAAPLLRRPHGGAGARLLPPARRHPLRRQRVLGSGPHALQLEERRVAHGPGARGGPRDRPRAGPDALAARPGAHAPQCHAARLEGAVAGRAVGAAPALRLPGPAARVRVLGTEGPLRRPPAAHEEALPQQLRLLLRIPLPHGGRHPTAPQDQNQAGARGQECHLPLWPEDPPQERQSVLVQGPGAPRVLLPRLPGTGRGTPEHHRQRRERGHLHVCGAPAPACAHDLLLACPCEELSSWSPAGRQARLIKHFLSDVSAPFLGRVAGSRWGAGPHPRCPPGCGEPRGQDIPLPQSLGLRTQLTGERGFAKVVSERWWHPQAQEPVGYHWASPGSAKRWVRQGGLPEGGSWAGLEEGGSCASRAFCESM
uniref:Peptidase M10 metallopeptidase domain-containing protein n=1 Tax=Prolemur simus TaxID=1328070 RepID=A0A8C8ZQ55_PROSS